MKRILLISLLLLSSAVVYSQGSGTPSTIIVKVDANGYLVVAGATQTNPVTQGTFSSRVLRTDATGALLVVVTGGAFSGQLLGPAADNCAAPPYSFQGDTNTGICQFSVNNVALQADGTIVARAASTGFNLNVAAFFGWGSSGVTSVDLTLFREGARHLFQRDSTNANRFSVANTYTSPTNYESFSVDWQTTVGSAIVGTRTAATGTAREIFLVSQANNGSNTFGVINVAPASVRIGAWSTSTGFTNAVSGQTGNRTSLAEWGSSATSGIVNMVAITPTYNQSGSTAANTDLLINRTQTAVGSGAQLLIDAQVGGSSRFSVNNNGNIVTTGATANGYGTTADTSIGHRFQGTITAPAGSAIAQQFSGSLTASANGDQLIGINAAVVSYAKGAFTGLTADGIRLAGSNMSASGGGTIANASVLHIIDATTIGTNNFSLWVDAGTTRLDGDVRSNTSVYISATAPTIGSGFGTSPTVPNSNGTAAFTINVGTGGTATGGVITMPAATTGWNCAVENRTSNAANRANQRTLQTATTTTSVTVQNQTISTGAALAWAASDILAFHCMAY